jgi:peptidoglycan/xylan/chitin deacetylase (PgdA/CDA1 family)
MRTFPANFLKSLMMLTLAFTTASGVLAAQNAQPAFHWPEGKRVAVSLSFDDARASQIDVGLPLFDKYSAKVTFYVNPKNMEPRLEGWKKAAAKGYEIGNHTSTHPCTGNFDWSRNNALENYTVAMIAKEMDGANADIERMVGVKAATFAYPCGEKYIGRSVETQSYVPLVAKRFLAARGFRDEAANNPAFCDLAQLLGVDSDGMSFEEMKKGVNDATKNGGWLVFAGHEIGEPAYQTTGTAILEQFLKYAKDPTNGIWLDTIEAVAKYIQAQRGGK